MQGSLSGSPLPPGCCSQRQDITGSQAEVEAMCTDPSWRVSAISGREGFHATWAVWSRAPDVAEWGVGSRPSHSKAQQDLGTIYVCAKTPQGRLRDAKTKSVLK